MYWDLQTSAKRARPQLSRWPRRVQALSSAGHAARVVQTPAPAHCEAVDAGLHAKWGFCGYLHACGSVGTRVKALTTGNRMQLGKFCMQ